MDAIDYLSHAFAGIVLYVRDRMWWREEIAGYIDDWAYAAAEEAAEPPYDPEWETWVDCLDTLAMTLGCDWPPEAA